MKVALVSDWANADGTIGGAELTMREFGESAPDGVDIVDNAGDADVVVVGNCVTFAPAILSALEGRSVIRYHHDLSRAEHPQIAAWMAQNAVHAFTSPAHWDWYDDRIGDVDVGHIVPPVIDLDAFRPTRQIRRNGKRAGAVSIGSWQGPGKGQRALEEWSRENEPVDVYGGGPLTPTGPALTYRGLLEHGDVAQTLWRYERFVFLPTEPEPFGRCVVEAWAAGCNLIVNEMVGALDYIRHDPDALERAAADFWDYVAELEVPA